MINHDKNELPTLSENEILAVRREKLEQLRQKSQPVFPNNFRQDAFAEDLQRDFGEFTQEILEQNKTLVKLAGRIMTVRLMGKASFITIQDMTGRIQVYIRRDDVTEAVFNEFKRWDIGDIIGVTGRIFKTKTGELSVRASTIELLTKALRPLPDKFHGLVAQEARYRQRYLDLIVNESSRRIFKTRSKIINYIRDFLTERHFLEVETPMMQVLAGGAAAKPFITYHNALDMELFLRVAPELYLKRLVVGGFERVFEINRNFRNEGLSTRHNPEFTMLEFYQAYADYEILMDLTESMLRGLTKTVLGSELVSYQDCEIDFAKPFRRLTMIEAILEYNPNLKIEALKDRESAAKIASELNIMIKPSYGLGKIQLEIFEKTVEHRLLDPTFIIAYPAEVSPLARRNDSDPLVTDRFEFFVAGREIANGFSELNDPDDQAARFRQQAKEKAAGDDEAMVYDEDYINALEHGMPPTAGEGIGIDRLVMLLTNSASIRDVILFPHMRLK